MYLKEAFPIQPNPTGKGFVKNIEDAESSEMESLDSGDELSDVKDPVAQAFHWRCL